MKAAAWHRKAALAAWRKRAAMKTISSSNNGENSGVAQQQAGGSSSWRKRKWRHRIAMKAALEKRIGSGGIAIMARQWRSMASKIIQRKDHRNGG